ncbi:hypothetical protein PIB30_066897, partial [Stylosanthes scabra]|nr:hypothetical protein [Stylosanthes scabra]
ASQLISENRELDVMKSLYGFTANIWACSSTTPILGTLSVSLMASVSLSSCSANKKSSSWSLISFINELLSSGGFLKLSGVDVSEFVRAKLGKIVYLQCIQPKEAQLHYHHPQTHGPKSQ